MAESPGASLEALGNWLAAAPGRFVNVRAGDGLALACGFHTSPRDRASALDVGPGPLKGPEALLAGEPLAWLMADPDRRCRITLRRGVSRARAKVTLYHPIRDAAGLTQRVTYLGIADTMPDALGKAWSTHLSRPGRKPDGPVPPPVSVGESFHREKNQSPR